MAVVLAAVLGWAYWPRTKEQVAEIPRPATVSPSDGNSTTTPRQVDQQEPRFFDYDGIVFWWDGIPERVREVSLETGPRSNMDLADYIGPEACQQCHQKNYEQWSVHPHKRMNAIADEENVLGDFSGDQHIDYLSGRATFYRRDGGYRMKLVRDDMQLIYEVRQTIGSRFFQYYVGRLLEGPFTSDHPYRHINHVLPFGFWLERQQWIPVVHLYHEPPDGLRHDPFDPLKTAKKGIGYTPYASSCSVCHTTFALADDLTRKPRQIAQNTPVRMHWNMGAYFQHSHPELWGSFENPADVPAEEIDQFPIRLMDFEADEHAVTLGVSCEACHLGCKEHVEDPKITPDFHPRSPLLRIQSDSPKIDFGRTQQNVNWICARCHVGERPQFAAGMSTWNSVEYSDAMLGSCYSQLKCIDCHPPHQATGVEWTRSPQQDDAS